MRFWLVVTALLFVGAALLELAPWPLDLLVWPPILLVIFVALCLRPRTRINGGSARYPGPVRRALGSPF